MKPCEGSRAEIKVNKLRHPPFIAAIALPYSLTRLIFKVTQFAGAGRHIYARVLMLYQSGRAVASLDARAGSGVLRHVGRALHVRLGAAFVVHVPVGALERYKHFDQTPFLLW
jgi:hypothetical protein